jgi:hypothetical protein
MKEGNIYYNQDEATQTLFWLYFIGLQIIGIPLIAWSGYKVFKEFHAKTIDIIRILACTNICLLVIFFEIYTFLVFGDYHEYTK